MDDTQTTWQRIEQSELDIEGVTPGTSFGRSDGLRVRGKIYAISKDGEPNGAPSPERATTTGRR